MPKLTIVVHEDSPTCTVSEMRRRLARALSRLPGEQEVSFTFSARIGEYLPAAQDTGALYDDFCNTPVDGCKTGRLTAKYPALGAPYNLKVPPLQPKINIVMGELARPEND